MVKIEENKNNDNNSILNCSLNNENLVCNENLGKKEENIFDHLDEIQYNNNLNNTNTNSQINKIDESFIADQDSVLLNLESIFSENNENRHVYGTANLGMDNISDFKLLEKNRIKFENSTNVYNN
jgi:hypothetical protein